MIRQITFIICIICIAWENLRASDKNNSAYNIRMPRKEFMLVF